MESSHRLNSSYIAVEFNGSEKKLLNTFESVETSYSGNEYIPVEARYLTSGELETNESKTYTIKLWMDESVTVEDDAMNKSFISKIVVTAKQSHIVKLVDYIMSETSKDFEKFEHPETYQTPALTDYRYTGSNPNNYVCFGSEESVCPEDNLYRIIGVIPTQSEIGGEYENRVKLIKNDYYTENESGLLKSGTYAKGGYGYPWSNISSNEWESSALNIQVLNNVYWNSLGDYQKYIGLTNWYLGGATYRTYSQFTPNNLYQNERSNTLATSKGALNIVTNIGLMYPSDYGYSIGKNSQDETISNNIDINAGISNQYVKKAWLYILEENTLQREITISPESQHYASGSHLAITIYANGIVYAGIVHSAAFTVRPTFYLKCNVLYESGNGTQENPYRISINE